MSAFEVLSLDPAVPQIRAPGAGDTYSVPREMVISVDSASDALRVTQIGAGNALVVEDSANPDATPFVVTAAGSVGIGGTPPTPLYVKATAGGTDPTVVTGERVRIQSNDTTGRSAYLSTIAGTAANSGILFGDQDAADVGRILYAHGDNSMRFTTNSAEVARFDSSGNLGIGTTSPGGKLHVGGTGYSFFSSSAYLQTPNTAGLSIGYNRSGGNGETSLVWSAPASGFNFEICSFASSTITPRLTIDTSGNLGLGVTPSAWSSAFGPVIQVKAATGGGALTGSSADNFRMFANTFYDGAYKRIDAGYATQYEQAAGQHSWYTAGTSTANSSITFTQAMTLDASGNLCLNTTNAVSKLVIFEGAAAGATVPAVITLGPRSTTVASGEVLGRVQFYSNDASPSSAGVVGKIDCIATSTFVGDCETALTFHTNDGAAGTIAERVRITAAGEILVGTSSASASANAGAKIFPGGTMRCVNADSTNSTENWSMYSTGAANYRFYVGWGGTVYATNTTISAISDQRFKENIQDLDVGLDAILALKPRKFDWKEGKGKDIKGDRGFIAQEIAQVFPDLVDEWKDPAPEGEEPYKSVRQDLIPVLVKAIQELTARVAALESK